MLNLKRIEEKYLILCEGADAEGFLKEYLRRTPEQHSAIQVADFGGNQELRKSLALLRNTDGFSELCSLLIIRDAEKNIQSALDQIRFALKDNYFPMPKTQGEWEAGAPRTCFLLFPHLGRKFEAGTLEDLCMSILAESEVSNIMGRIDAFLDALRQDGLRDFSHLHKTKLHTYFSTTNKFVTKNVGLAAQAGAFDWSHPNLAPLKDCLSKMEGG